MENNLSGSLINYLLVIYEEQKDVSKGVQPNIISTKLGVSRAAVTKAMNRLASHELITKVHYGDIYLSQEGRTIVKELIERCNVITDFLIKLGVNEKDAASQSKILVPVIHDEVYFKIKESLNEN